MKLLLIPILVVLSFSINAQNVNMPDVTYKLGDFNQKVSVTYNPSGATSNFIIEKLAEGNGKGPRSTEFLVSYNQKILLNYNGSGKELVITSDKMKISGDLYYKGFSMADQLYPSRMQFDLILYKGTSQLNNYSFTIYIDKGQPAVLTKAYPDSAYKGMRAEVKNIRFEYGHVVIAGFQEEVREVDEYYSAGHQLDQAKLLLESIFPGNFDNIESEQRKLYDAKAILSSIDACNYSATLDLSVYDPVNLERKLSMLRSLSISKEQDLKTAYLNLYLTFYEQGKYFMRAGNVSKAMYYFEKSIKQNPSFAPALYQLARINLKEGDIDEAKSISSDILLNLNPDPETRHLTEELLKDVYETYLDKAATKLNQKKFSKAEEYLDEAHELCERFSGIRCSEELFSMISQAHNGIYNEMIAVASELYKQNKYDDAESRVQDAASYRQKYKEEIKQAESEKLIITGIRQRQFDIRISDAKRNYDSRNFGAALDDLDAAEELYKLFQLKEYKDFYRLKTDYAKSYAFSLLDKGDGEVVANNLKQARVYLNQVEQLISNYQLGADKSLLSRTERLTSGIFTTQCRNAQNELNSFLSEASRAVSRNDYRIAGKAYEMADSLALANSECGLNLGSMVEERSAILPAIAYYRLFDKAELLMKKQNYLESFNIYNETEKYYGQFDVGRFKILHKPQYEYILSSGTSGMLVFAGEHYRSKNKLDNAIGIYEELLRKGHDFRLLKGAMYKLGIETGKRDKSVTRGDDWKDFVKKYHEGDREWKSFKKGYKKGWKI